MSSVLHKLLAMREYFEDERHWTQRADARTSWGSKVAPTAPDACCHCLIGYVRFADPLVPYGDNPMKDFLYDALWEIKGASSLVSYNDHPDRRHADILMLIDRAIDLASVRQ